MIRSYDEFCHIIWEEELLLLFAGPSLSWPYTALSCVDSQSLGEPGGHEREEVQEKEEQEKTPQSYDSSGVREKNGQKREAQLLPGQKQARNSTHKTLVTLSVYIYIYVYTFFSLLRPRLAYNTTS